MGNNTSSMLQDEEIDIISDETKFSATQIERLYTRFKSLDKSVCGSLSRQDFLQIPELAINPLCDRIVHMFFVDCDDDHERINFRQFCNVLSVFKSPNSTPPTSSSNHNQQPATLSANNTSNSINNNSNSFSQNKVSSISRNASRQDGLNGANGSISSIFNSLNGDNRSSRHSSSDGLHHHHHHHNHHHHHSTTNQHSIHYVASSNQLAPSNLHSLSQNHEGKEQKLFMFKIYDVNNDNQIDLEDVISILRMLVGTYLDESRIVRIARRNLIEHDLNGDGLIDFDEFCQTFSVKWKLFDAD